MDGEQVIDLWTDQPPKTQDTPCFNRLSMERFYDRDVRQGEAIDIEILLVNEDVRGGVGTAFTLAGRLGGYEILEPEQGIDDALRIAKSVDVPIVMAGLSADYESENSDRQNLDLPSAATRLIEAVLSANPNTVSLVASIPNTLHKLSSPCLPEGGLNLDILLTLSSCVDCCDPIRMPH